MAKELNQRSLERLKGVDPILVEIFMTGTKNSPYEYQVADKGGRRTTKEQGSLFAIGRTLPGRIVTWCDGIIKRSNHQDGKAVDIICYVDGVLSWDLEVFKAVATHLKKFALEKKKIVLKWGGDWPKKKRESPHFQI